MLNRRRVINPVYLDRDAALVIANLSKRDLTVTLNEFEVSIQLSFGFAKMFPRLYILGQNRFTMQGQELSRFLIVH